MSKEITRPFRDARICVVGANSSILRQSRRTEAGIGGRKKGAKSEDLVQDSWPVLYRIFCQLLLSISSGYHGAPHTKAFGHGLFELRLKGAEGIARVFFCTLVGKRIVMLHSFVKKSEKTPRRDREIAETRMNEVKDANT